MRDSARFLTRRSFLQAIGLAFASRFRPIAHGLQPLAGLRSFTSIEGTDLAWLMRWFCFGGHPRFAGAG